MLRKLMHEIREEKFRKKPRLNIMGQLYEKHLALIVFKSILFVMCPFVVEEFLYLLCYLFLDAMVFVEARDCA